jgi:hypothetical protein
VEGLGLVFVATLCCVFTIIAVAGAGAVIANYMRHR